MKLENRYELLDELGRGGMGVVYRARDPLLERDVAVKMIPPSHFHEKAVEHFEREARLVAQMDHPAIVPIYDFGRQEGALYFVMPLVQGTELSKILASAEDSLSLDEIIDLGIQVADALDYSHARDVIHRDIKPGNLMISRGDVSRGDAVEGGGESVLRARVMDFGLARNLDEARSRTDGLSGTLTCVSPEQIAGSVPDGRSDIYALGTVLYECLAGEPPFIGPVHNVLYRISQEEPRRFQAMGVEVEPELEEIVLRCLAKRPEERPQRARDVAQALEGFRRGHAGRAMGGGATGNREFGTHASRPEGTAPLIGRRNELRRLQESLEASLNGELHFVLLGGETGIGKSRLLEEIAHLAVLRDFRVLRGRFSGRGSAFPLQGICELILEDFRAQEGSEAEDFADLAPDLIAYFPVFSEVPLLASIKPPATAEEEAESTGEKAAGELRGRVGEPREQIDLYELLARTLARLNAGRPTIFLLEHLQEDAEACDALRYIARRLGPTPTLMIASFRSEEITRSHPVARLVESFRDDRRFQLIRLGALDVEEMRALALQELRLRKGEREARIESEEDWLDDLVRSAEGNPFFLRELLRSLRADGILTSREGFWRLDKDRTFALPETIHQAVDRRLRRLDPELQRILALASLIGRRFDVEDLEALAAEEDFQLDLDDALDDLIAEGLLQEDARRGHGDELNFSSSVVRDVFYAGLSRRRRRTLHRRHAEHLQKRWKNRPERVYAQLVRHFYDADMPRETVHYSLAMARNALHSLSAEEAHWALDKALEMIDDGEIEQADRRAGELHALRAEAFRLVSDHDRALAAADRAVEVLNHTESNLEVDTTRAEMLLSAAETAWHARRIDAARERIERCLVEARRAVEATVETETKGAAKPPETTDADSKRIFKKARAGDILRRALHLAGTVANLRGAFREAHAFLEEAGRLAADRVAVPSEAEDGDEEIVASVNDSAEEGGRLIVALPHSIRHLGPGIATTDEEAEITAILYENLLMEGSDGNPAPNLCARWEASDDARTFVFELRSERFFSNGTPLTADAIRTSLEATILNSGDPAPALRVIEGFEALRSGTAERLSGVRTEGKNRLVVRLVESLPTFPVMLTDPSCAIALEEHGSLLGTGPFRLLGRQSRHALLLERNPHAARRSRLDTIELRTEVDPSRIAADLRAGEIDLARDLLPTDLEAVLRDPQLSGGLVEATKQNTYFVLFRADGPLARLPQLRRALAGRVHTPDLVWRSLGRFARPAVDLLPPDMLGHQPARRHPALNADEARESIDALDLARPIRLRAAIHPLYQDRFASLCESLFAVWREIGVEVVSVTPTMEEYLDRWTNCEDLDLLIGRWTAGFRDPDAFTYPLFHSRVGMLRSYFSSRETDHFLEEARCENDAERRSHLYRQFVDDLTEKSIVIPLFHEIDYRVAGPRLRGLRLENRFPYVNYDRLIKMSEEQEKEVVLGSNPLGGSASRSEIHIPTPGILRRLDPAAGNIIDHLEVLGNIFEPLTRVGDGGRIIPGLAAFFDLNESRSFHFRLRERLRFQDGRRVTARDVRFTFERLLRGKEYESAFLLLPILGARALRAGESDVLDGLKILSEDEILIELEQPLAFFPALLAHPTLAILPESSIGDAPVEESASWREGCVGTGPFRILRFLPGRLLELEGNPFYWRRGLPRSERLTFHLGLTPDQIRDGFLEGRFSLASDIAPEDVERLRLDARFAGCFHEVPRLSTAFLAANLLKGPLADPEIRRAFFRCLSLDEALANSGRTLVRAAGILPPGLLGAVSDDPTFGRHVSISEEESVDDRKLLRGLTVRIMLHSVFDGPQAGAWAALRAQMEDLGLVVEASIADPATFMDDLRAARVDLAIFRWNADYADSDAFMTALLHSKHGLIGDVCGSSQLDHLIDRGRHEGSPALRHETYREIERLLAREYRVVSWFHEQVYRLRNPDVSGLQLHMSLPEVRYEELVTSG